MSEGRRVWPHESGTVTEKPRARRRLDVLEPPRHGPGEVLTSWLGYRKTTGWTGTPGMKAPAEKGQEGTTSRLAAADATPSPRASCGLAGQQRPVESPRLCWWKTGCRPRRQAAERVPPGTAGSEGLPHPLEEKRKDGNSIPGLKVIRQVRLVHVPSGKIMIWKRKERASGAKRSPA